MHSKRRDGWAGGDRLRIAGHFPTPWGNHLYIYCKQCEYGWCIAPYSLYASHGLDTKAKCEWCGAKELVVKLLKDFYEAWEKSDSRPEPTSPPEVREPKVTFRGPNEQGMGRLPEPIGGPGYGTPPPDWDTR